jgi:excisionase family DNA binding protein
MTILVSIDVVAELFGVTTQTIRNWSDEGMLKFERTHGGHRRYILEDIERIKGIENSDEKSTVVYSRVSSYDQREDMKRQEPIRKLLLAANSDASRLAVSQNLKSSST